MKRAAAERIAALVDPALDAMHELIEGGDRMTRYLAARDILDRAGHSAKQKAQLEHSGKLQVEVVYSDSGA